MLTISENLSELKGRIALWSRHLHTVTIGYLSGQWHCQSYCTHDGCRTAGKKCRSSHV